MPIIKSAKKKLRQDAKKKKMNLKYKTGYEKIVGELKKNKDNKSEISKLVKKAYSIIDKAAKKNVFHKNKANRLKSQITKFMNGK